MPILAEYIWIDGTQPSKQLRSKTKVMGDDAVFASAKKLPPITAFSGWGADGSSTNQATGRDSDIGLSPVCVVRDPIRSSGHNYLVLCEVTNPDGSVHASNTRAELRSEPLRAINMRQQATEPKGFPNT